MAARRYLSIIVASFALSAIAAIVALSPIDLSIERSIEKLRFDVAFIADFGAAPADELRLQAALHEGAHMVLMDPPTLNRDLRLVDVRTALEDNRRLHRDLG